MHTNLPPLANTLGDLFYSPMVRKIVGSVVALWVLMMVLGIEVLTSTEHVQHYVFTRADDYLDDEGYDCTYWTGLSLRVQRNSPYGFSGCPVWRWGRQAVD
jgi:hypothetical protein